MRSRGERAETTGICRPPRSILLAAFFTLEEETDADAIIMSR
jgi:hypothetical protein